MQIQKSTGPLDPPPTPKLDVDPNNDQARYVGVASIPRRSDNLRLAISSLYSQADHFFVYLNDYERVPDWLDDPKITFFRSQDYIDLNATGKVFFANILNTGYYFTIDDDFIYPSDYIDYLCATIEKYDRRVAVCVHGSVFPETVEYYYLRTAAYQYQQQLLSDRFVCLPGTGSFGVHLGNFPMKLESFLPQVMVDLACAILCKSRGVPLVAVRRPQFWLQNTDREGLYQKFQVNRTHHSDYAEMYGPWGFQEYAPAIAEIAQSVGFTHANYLDLHLDDDAFEAAKSGSTPTNWQKSPKYYELLIESMRNNKVGKINDA